MRSERKVQPAVPVSRANDPRQNPSKPALFLMTDGLQVGGTERQFCALAKALVGSHFDLSLGCLQRKGSFLQEIGEISEFPSGGSFLSFRAQASRFALARQLRMHGTAIAHSMDFYSNLMLVPTALLAGVPVVIGSQRQIGDLLTPLQTRVQNLVFRFCDRVICNSRAAAAPLVRHGHAKERIAVIPNGLFRSAFNEVPPSLPRSRQIVRIGLIARMNDRVKNHAGFLRTAAKVAPKFPSAQFVLVGDGPLRPDLELLAAELGLGLQVRFLGERQDIPGVLAALDVSVVFSSSESLSNVALESMAAALPVVATRVGGNPEIVRDGENGLLVDPGDEEGLANALEHLITRESLRTAMGRRGKELALANFAMEQIVKQHEQLYSDILGEKSWRPAINRQSVRSRPLQWPLRVAIVAASPRWIGGQGVQAETLIRNWQNDPAVNARFIPIDPKFPRALRWAERIPIVRTLVRTPLYWAQLWWGTRDVDAVHIFSASYWSFLLAPLPAWLVARLRRKKTLINYHSAEAEDHLSRSAIAVRVLKAADRIVVPSRYLVEVFRRFDIAAEAVPNNVNLEQFAFRVRQPLRPRLICSRGFHRYYSVDIVVRAFALVKEQFPEAELCLVGSGPEEKRIRELVKQLQLHGVKFTGPVPHDEIHRCYAENDIFINGSWLDNAPISILEAFASGTPVVTTAAPGIRFIVEHEQTGLLCEAGDWKLLGHNVIRLLKQPEFAQQLARNAYQELEQYRWKRVREQWLEVYRSVLLPEMAGYVQGRSHPGAVATREAASQEDPFHTVERI